MDRLKSGPPNYPTGFVHHGGLCKEPVYYCWICHLDNCYSCGTVYQGWTCCDVKLSGGIAECQKCCMHPSDDTKLHELKITPKFFDDISKGLKCFEIRQDDRGFKRLDRLFLKEWNGDEFTGRELLVTEVSYLLKHEDFPEGIPPGFCIMGFSNPYYRNDGSAWRVI